jgi:hypothetical protein
MHKQEITMHNQEAQEIHSSAAIYPAGGSSSGLTSYHLAINLQWLNPPLPASPPEGSQFELVAKRGSFRRMVAGSDVDLPINGRSSYRAPVDSSPDADSCERCVPNGNSLFADFCPGNARTGTSSATWIAAVIISFSTFLLGVYKPK